ncbi:hypothetical protein D3C81_1345920 [compost metagenome]
MINSAVVQVENKDRRSGFKCPIAIIAGIAPFADSKMLVMPAWMILHCRIPLLQIFLEQGECGRLVFFIKHT